MQAAAVAAPDASEPTRSRPRRAPRSAAALPHARRPTRRLTLDQVTLSFGGITALSNVDLTVVPRRDPGHHRAERRWQELADQPDQRHLPAGQRHDRASAAARYSRACRPSSWPHSAWRAPSRTWRCSPGSDVIDNVAIGLDPSSPGRACSAQVFGLPGARTRHPPRARRRPSRSWPSSPDRARAPARRHPGLRAAEAGGARTGADRTAAAAAARRAHGRHERAREAGDEPLHPRRPRPVRHDDRADRARHRRRHGAVRPHRRARPWLQDRRRAARTRSAPTRRSSTPIWASTTDHEAGGIALMADFQFFLEVLLGGLLSGVMYALVAIGFVVIYKTSGVLNFAQGALVLFAALTFVSLVERGVPFWGAMAITLVAMVVDRHHDRADGAPAAGQPAADHPVHGDAGPVLRDRGRGAAALGHAGPRAGSRASRTRPSWSGAC